jgi:hypothetical protein
MISNTGLAVGNHTTKRGASSQGLAWPLVTKTNTHTRTHGTHARLAR